MSFDRLGDHKRAQAAELFRLARTAIKTGEKAYGKKLLLEAVEKDGQTGAVTGEHPLDQANSRCSRWPPAPFYSSSPSPSSSSSPDEPHALKHGSTPLSTFRAPLFTILPPQPRRTVILFHLTEAL